MVFVMQAPVFMDALEVDPNSIFPIRFLSGSVFIALRSLFHSLSFPAVFFPSVFLSGVLCLWRVCVGILKNHLGLWLLGLFNSEIEVPCFS